MNERIKEIHNKAVLSLSDSEKHALGSNFEMALNEKFAELIVRECIGRVQLQNRMDESSEQWIYDNLVDDFKEHFGVTK